MDGGREERKRKFPLLFLGLELRIALVRRVEVERLNFKVGEGEDTFFPFIFFLNF